MEFTLDTNAYRGLIAGKKNYEVLALANILKTGEKETGHSSVANTVVMMELIKHLQKGDPFMEDCYNALCLQFFHSAEYEAAQQKFSARIYPPMNVVLAKYFFNDSSKYLDLYKVVVHNVGCNLAIAKDINACFNYEKEINAVKSQLTFEREEFVNNVEEFLSSLNNGIVDWRYIVKTKEVRKNYFDRLHNGDLAKLLGFSMMIRAHQVVEREELDEDAANKFPAFFERYQAAIIMNLSILESLGHGVEKMKDVNDPRWNTLNDVSIMLGLLHESQKDDDKVLVTNEKKIKEAATAAGIGHRVITLEGYLSILGVDLNT